MEKTAEDKLDIGVLVEPMDIGTEGFRKLQGILLNKSIRRAKSQNASLDTLAIKYEIEDYLSSEDSDKIMAGIS